MKFIRSHSLLMIFALIFGIGIFGTAQTANAQQSKPKMEKKQQQDDDDDEKEESPEQQAKLAKQAKITKEQARKIALKRVPGEIIEAEIEKEKGKLIWSFDIRKEDGTIWDVEIDAKNGKVLQAVEDNEDEDDNDDDDGNMSQNKNLIQKTIGGIENTSAKVFHKITGN